MAMAHKAPMDHYKRTNYISLHAVEQLRLRIGRKHELFHRDNSDLSNAIDQAVCDAIKKDENVEKFEYEGKPNIGVNISGFFGFPLRAILAKNEKKDSQYRTAVVTILTLDMTKTMRKTGASIGDAISPEVKAALRAAIDAEKQAEAPQSKPVAETPVAPKAAVRSVVEAKPNKISTRDVSVDRRLISYLKENETTLTVEEFAAPGDLRNRIFELHQKGKNLDEVTVWKPSRASIAIALDFEEG